MSPDGKLQKSSAKKSRKGRWIAFSLLVLFALVAAAVAADYWVNSGKIYRGVQVGSVDLSGKTPAQAREIVGEHVNGSLRKIELEGPEGKITRTAEEMGVEFSVGATVEKAYSVGREGKVLDQVSQRARAMLGGVSIPAGVDYSPQTAQAEIEEIASKLDHDPRDSSLDISGADVQLTKSREGYRANVGATVENVSAAVEDATGDAEIAGKTLEPELRTSAVEGAADKARAAMSKPLVVYAQGERWSYTPEQVGSALDIVREGDKVRISLDRGTLVNELSDVFASLTAEPVEAGYVVRGSGVVVTPGQNGQSMEGEKFLDNIQTGIFEGRHQFTVPVLVERPRLTTAEAERLKPTQLIGSYDTNYLTYDDSAGRVDNLRIASNVVDGTVLAPGEVFSFNDLAAPLDYEKTKVIINGKVKKADGGGLCQVSTTLFMAANLAGLETIERHQHYAELPYIRPGLDATVWFGALDMKFQNTTDSYVLVRESVDTSTGNVYAEIWGQPTGRTVDMSSRKTYDSPKLTKWVTYKTVTDNGRVIQDGFYYKSEYQPLKNEEG